MKKITFLLTALLFSVMSFAQTTESVTLNLGSHDGTNITWTIAQGNITISQLKAASSTAVNANYVAAPRMYKGHILQFAAAEGYGITNISITYTGSYYGTGLYAGTAISDNVVTANTTDLTATYATSTSGGTHTIATVSAEGASLIALQIPNSAPSNYKQLRPTAISITYVKAATSEPTISCGDVNFGTVNSAVINSKEVEVIGENLGTEITASLESGTAFSINGTLTATGGTLTLTVTATTDGTYTDKLTLTSGTTSKEVEVSATVVVCEGEGTEEKPYTVNDVIKLANPAISAWVEGYIVGVMKNNELSTDDLSVNSNLALGATADATENIVPVALPSSTTIRTDLNLVDNSGNLGKKVAVYGLLDTYFSTTGVKNTSNYKWVAADGAPEAPTFTPAAGTYFAAQNVTITAEEGATIYYTIDGTDPTTASTVYSAPIAVGETTTVKAIAVKAEQSSPVASAKYTINLPLTTMDQIFAKATEVGSTATSVQVVMNNWVVTGVKASNAYVTDGTKGFIIYNASHGFVVGDILSGTVMCKVQLYNGSSELTELTSTTEGLTVTAGGVVTPVVVSDVTELKGVNTGSVVKITGTCTLEGSKYYVNGVQLYNSLFAYETPTVGNKYNVTGVYLQYYEIPEILPRQASDIELIPDALPSATISIANITMEVGEEKTIEANITPEDAQVTYELTDGTCITLKGATITAVSEGTATITATIAEKADEYTGVTKTFTVTVTPQNIATLPFAFDGKQADIANTLGMSHKGIDASDYGSSPYLKMNTTGDWLVIHFNGEPGKLSYDIKGNSYSGGTFTVQESVDGNTYTDIVAYTELGDKATKTHTLAATSRYVKFIYTEKVNGNVALGNIKIALPEEEPEQPGGGETPEERLTDWVLTPLADITTNDLVVITMTKGETTWAMTNNNGTSAAPAAPVVTLSADALAAEPDANLKWVVSNDNGTLTIYPYGDYETWLYCTNTNNGVRVGNGDAKEFTIDTDHLYTTLTTAPRYLGVYDGANWRCYTSINSNIKDQTLAFYVKKNANDVLPGTGEDPEEPSDDPVVPTPTINPTATFIFNTAEGLNDLGITYPVTPTTVEDGTEDAFKTEFENNAKFTQDGITMTTTGGTVVATRVWLTAAGKLDLRVYKGATLTFSVPENLQITTIAFNGSNINHLLVDGVAVNNNTWTGSKQEITFTAKEDASTIKINTIDFVVSYTRSISANYGTICLPYGSSNYSGAEFYEFVGKETGKVWLASVDKLEAGVPYVFMVKGTQLVVAYEGTPESTPGNKNGLYGTFTDNTPVAVGNYIISQGKVLAPCGTGCYVNANRAYVVMDEIPDGKPTQQMPGRRYIGMDVQGENETTGVEDLFTTDAPVKVIENGQLIIIRDGVKYNVQGVRL